MINKINLGFGPERTFLKKEKIIKIYNKGNIIISRPKSAKNDYQIISIKKCENSEKKIYKNKKIKKKLKKEKIEKEEDEIKMVGYILRNTFKNEELENITEFGPNSKKNKIKLNNKNKEKEEKSKKIKPYIPIIEFKEPNEINEKYLQRTLNIFKENEYIINQVNNILKKSKIMKEENKKNEKRKNSYDNLDELNIELEQLNADNKKEFIEIIDIKKDKKYIKAEKLLKNSKEDCEKMKEFVLKIDKQLKDDKIKTTEITNIKNNKKETKDEAKQIISEIKNNININNFNINKLNKEDQKLLKGGDRYNPYQRIKNIKNKNIDINKEYILINSKNSINDIKKSNKNMKKELKIKNKIDKKEKEISKKWKNNNECIKAYLNNYKKGKNIDINEIKEKKNIILENKNDIYNYIYMPKEYENHWYNNKDDKDKIKYKHPFLIYDD